LNISRPALKNKLHFGVNGEYEQDHGWIENDAAGMGRDTNRKNDRKLSVNPIFHFASPAWS
jgi:hypothetical protein